MGSWCAVLEQPITKKAHNRERDTPRKKLQEGEEITKDVNVVYEQLTKQYIANYSTTYTLLYLPINMLHYI